MTEQETKVHENRLRRKAERQGLRLVKSRRRDEDASDFGLYWLEDARSEPSTPTGKGLTLQEIEARLTHRKTGAE